jgi:hypothetical protein
MFLQVPSLTWIKYHNTALCSLQMAVADSHEPMHAMRSTWFCGCGMHIVQLGRMPAINRSHFRQLRICLMPSQCDLNQQLGTRLSTIFSSEAGS